MNTAHDLSPVRARRGRLAVVGLALLVLLVLALAACDGEGDDDAAVADPDEAEDTDETRDESDEPDDGADEALPVEQFPVGIVTPLSGPAAEVGQNYLDGAQLAADRVNAEGGVVVDGVRYELELIECDDEATPDGALACGERLATRDGVTVMTNLASWQVFALMGINEREGFLIIGGVQSAGFTEEDNPLVVRTFARADRASRDFVDKAAAFYEAQGEDLPRAVVMEVDNEVGAAVANAYESGWEAHGGEVADRIIYEQTATDHTTQVSEALRSDPELIMTTALCPPTALFAEQAIEQGYEGAFLLGPGCGSDAPRFVEEMGPEDSHGTLLETPVFHVDVPEVSEQVDLIVDALGEEGAEAPAFVAFNNITLLADAIEAAGTVEDLQAIKRGFEPAIEGPDLLDLYDFDPETGDVNMETYLGILWDGELRTFADEQAMQAFIDEELS